jgi:hypothetical protein
MTCSPTKFGYLASAKCRYAPPSTGPERNAAATPTGRPQSLAASA